ncbi:conserved exported hypothetical protein [Rhodospirillaceae bacterium LM-1]|nr:conserved exported hypothetical protein [Rhodospirillaceae bacterium LM-1]
MRLLAAFLLVLTLGVAAAPSLAGPPEVPKAKGEKCLAEPADMRRNHMSMLLHRRDATMHQGVRASANGLKACLDCHAVSNAEGQPVGIDNDKHFCRVCHDYAAVQVDCFDCHNSRPEAKKASSEPVADVMPPEATESQPAVQPEGAK